MKTLRSLQLLGAAKTEKRQAEYRKSLLHFLAKLGGQLFGPIPKGHRREFFCLDEHTWVWHEEWDDEQGERHIVTTRYDIRPGAILKSQGGRHYQTLTAEEAYNLRLAINLYAQQTQAALSPLLV